MLGVLGRQITRLYDGTIYVGCDTLKVVSWAVGKKLSFSAHLRQHKGYSRITDLMKNQSIGVA